MRIFPRPNFTLKALALLAMVSISACTSETEPEPEKTCRELGAELRQKVGGDNSAYQVLSPNGGEIYTTGDTLKIKVIGADDESDAQINIRFVDAAGTARQAIWPGLSGSVNLQDKCEYSTVLPDSIMAGSTKVRLVSSQVTIRVNNYNTPTFRDDSDSPFTIKAP